MSELPLRQPDDDLIPLLRKCNNDDLDPIVKYITQEGVASSLLEISNIYKRHSPNHTEYCDEICAEIQCFGGNTIANVFRGGEGVLYKEIVCDVASRLKVNFNEKRETEVIEQQIVLKILEKSWDKMSEQEKRELLGGISRKEIVKIPTEFPVVFFQAAFKAGGFASYQLMLAVANAIARSILGYGLPVVANTVLSRWVGVFAGPIGWAITALWTAYDIAGPAFRVTIPCVIHIAMLREKKMVEMFK